MSHCLRLKLGYYIKIAFLGVQIIRYYSISRLLYYSLDHFYKVFDGPTFPLCCLAPSEITPSGFRKSSNRDFVDLSIAGILFTLAWQMFGMLACILLAFMAILNVDYCWQGHLQAVAAWRFFQGNLPHFCTLWSVFLNIFYQDCRLLNYSWPLWPVSPLWN